MIRFPCHACGASLSAPDAAAGRNSNCTGCRAAVTVPVVAMPAPAQRVVVNMPESDQPEYMAPRLSPPAAILWFVLFLMSLAFSALSVYLAVKTMLFATAGRDDAASLVAGGIIGMPLWFQAIISGYVAARALDRLSQ